MTGGRAVGLGEGVEEVRQLLRGDTDAGILNFDPQTFLTVGAVFERGLDEHATFPGELDGVGNQVDHDLTQPGGIGSQPRRDVVEAAGGEVDAFGGRVGAEQLDDFLDQLLEVEFELFDFELAGLDPRKIEDVVDHPQERAGRRTDGRQVVLLTLVEARFGQQLDDADDAVHRCADFVAHVGQEKRLGAARLFRFFFGPLEVDGAFLDPFLQVFVELLELFVELPQPRVAFVDPPPHVFVGHGQEADFVGPGIADGF